MNASTGNGRFLAVFLAGAAVLIGGCAASTPSARSAPVSPSATAANSPSPAATTSAGAPPCPYSALSVLLGHARVEAGQAYYPIVFINQSGNSCTLRGFPGVSFTTGRTHVVDVGSSATNNDASPEHVITVPPEGTASALVMVLNARKLPGACRPTAVTAFRVIPPGLKDSVGLPFSGLTCGNPKFHVLKVNAVVIGQPATGSGAD